MEVFNKDNKTEIQIKLYQIMFEIKNSTKNTEEK